MGLHGQGTSSISNCATYLPKFSFGAGGGGQLREDWLTGLPGKTAVNKEYFLKDFGTQYAVLM